MSEIDARDFGRLEAQVELLQTEVTELSKDVKSLLELANQSKGGFWMGMAIASTNYDEEDYYREYPEFMRTRWSK
jgi:membrane protease subunit (stomatin/prohibitin family)